MAHKHNRRRVRHRTRRNRYDQGLPTGHETSYDPLSSLCDEPSFTVDMKPPLPNLSLAHGFFSATILQRTWQDKHTPDRTHRREICTPLHPRDISKEEVRNMRTFGGEPGEGPDEVGLCCKMQEMFDSMEWINT